jgi:hypothetical protein
MLTGILSMETTGVTAKLWSPSRKFGQTITPTPSMFFTSIDFKGLSLGVSRLESTLAESILSADSK